MKLVLKEKKTPKTNLCKNEIRKRTNKVLETRIDKKKLQEKESKHNFLKKENKFVGNVWQKKLRK